MNFTSFLANKCFEYLLQCYTEEGTEHTAAQSLASDQSAPSSPSFIQPPWSLNNTLFKSLCDGCGDCVSACENNILVLKGKGYPQLDFSRGSCSFCGACAESCSKKAFKYDPSLPPWDLHVQINSRCLAINKVICSTCVEHCDKNAITIPRLINQNKAPRILTDACNGCGACFAGCPVGAIEIRQKEPIATLTSEENL